MGLFLLHGPVCNWSKASLREALVRGKLKGPPELSHVKCPECLPSGDTHPWGAEHLTRGLMQPTRNTKFLIILLYLKYTQDLCLLLHIIFMFLFMFFFKSSSPQYFLVKWMLQERCRFAYLPAPCPCPPGVRLQVECQGSKGHWFC